MKYQLRNSTVTFTNQSVNTNDVTGWRWLLDSGSGFVEVATTLNADITFPDVAGQLCTVKLVADGPFASEVKFEEQYMTVENLPAPEITPLSISGKSGSFVEAFITIVAGTGAGELEWEIIGDPKGLAIDTVTGRVHGILPARANAYAFAVTVTDALGRSDTKVINVSALAQYYGNSLFDVQPGGSVITYDPGTMKVSAVADMHEYANLAQAVSVNQPLLVPDDGDGFRCVQFAENVHGLAVAASCQWDCLFAVLKLNELPATLANSLFGWAANVSDFGGVYLNSSGVLRAMYPNGSAYGTMMPLNIADGKLVIAGLRKPGVTTTTMRFFVNGILFGSGAASAIWGPFYGASMSARVGYTATNTSGSTTPNSARMNLYHLQTTFYGPAGRFSLAETNAILQHLSARYGVPVKVITQAVWDTL